ncbi:MAG TPA: Rieske (2Fe-2S) protein [Xanthomonadaceae bacterium]|nr:Rieske (2Fe-2S) protein [Xanthomonadaceae bacterium]
MNANALCHVQDVPDGGALSLHAEFDGQVHALIVLRRGEDVRAFHNVCPHAGRRLDWAPGQFLLSAGDLVCAAHGATFRIPDGVCVAGPCRGDRLREVAVRIAEGCVVLV